MQDKVIQEKKARKKSFDLRKTTKAHEATVFATKKRLQQIAQKEASNQNTKTPLRLAGKVPRYYPEGKINKILSERDKDGMTQEDSVKEDKINPLTQSLPNEEEMQRLMLVIDQPPEQP